MSVSAHTREALLLSGQEALNRGDFERAVSDFSALTQIAPRAVVAWCGRAAAYFGANEFPRALAAAKRAHELAPSDSRSYFVLAPPAYALADHAAIELCKSFINNLDAAAGRPMASFWAQRLSEKNYFPEAAEAFVSFASRHADDIDVGIQSVDILLNAFRLDDAEAVLERIAERGAPAARIDALFSRIHVTRGDIEAASAAARRAIAADPDCIVAYSVLSEIEPAAIDESLDAHLHALISSDAIPIGNRIVGGVALGRAREKRGDIDGAFAAFSISNRLSTEELTAAGVRYDQAATEADALREIARFPSALVETCPAIASPRLAFIIGMPRSGSTLIDQILSRHSRALSVGESMIVPETVNGIAHEAKASGRSYRDCAVAQRDAFHGAYQRASDGAELVVDKNLFNFQHCGLVADLAPGARFVLALRNPGDIALSVFRTRFLVAHPWSNDLDDIAHMIACFEMLTNHWRQILGERLLVLEHEAIIGDFEGQVCALLDFCGLDFERACLEFHDSARPVFTQSAAQVRRQINADGVGRWRRYERHLAPFWRALEAHRARLRAKA